MRSVFQPVRRALTSFIGRFRGARGSAEAGGAMDDDLPPGGMIGFAEAPEEWRDRESGPEPREKRKRAPAARKRVEAAEPPGAAVDDSEAETRLQSRHFTCAAGSRDYLLYVPPLLRRRPAGLVLMLHGCGQSAADFARGTGMNALAREHHLIVAYPEQSSAYNPMHCWNWFRPQDQERGHGEPAILAGLAEELAEEFHLPRTKLFAAGLSAGGAMAAVLAEAYPDVFSAVGIHSGIATGQATDMSGALAAMRGENGRAVNGVEHEIRRDQPRAIIFQGLSDRTVHPSNAERILAAARAGRKVSAVEKEEASSDGNRSYKRLIVSGRKGLPLVESWTIQGSGHAWSGGRAEGSFTDPAGPDASAEMVRFFLGSAGR